MINIKKLLTLVFAVSLFGNVFALNSCFVKSYTYDGNYVEISDINVDRISYGFVVDRNSPGDAVDMIDSDSWKHDFIINYNGQEQRVNQYEEIYGGVIKISKDDKLYLLVDDKEYVYPNGYKLLGLFVGGKHIVGVIEKNNKQYLYKDGEVILVDKFCGDNYKEAYIKATDINTNGDYISSLSCKFADNTFKLIFISNGNIIKTIKGYGNSPESYVAYFGDYKIYSYGDYKKCNNYTGCFGKGNAFINNKSINVDSVPGGFSIKKIAIGKKNNFLIFNRKYGSGRVDYYVYDHYIDGQKKGEYIRGGCQLGEFGIECVSSLDKGYFTKNGHYFFSFIDKSGDKKYILDGKELKLGNISGKYINNGNDIAIVKKGKTILTTDKDFDISQLNELEEAEKRTINKIEKDMSDFSNQLRKPIPANAVDFLPLPGGTSYEEDKTNTKKHTTKKKKYTITKVLEGNGIYTIKREFYINHYSSTCDNIEELINKNPYKVKLLSNCIEKTIDKIYIDGKVYNIEKLYTTGSVSAFSYRENKKLFLYLNGDIFGPYDSIEYHSIGAALSMNCYSKLKTSFFIVKNVKGTDLIFLDGSYKHYPVGTYVEIGNFYWVVYFPNNKRAELNLVLCITNNIIKKYTTEQKIEKYKNLIFQKYGKLIAKLSKQRKEKILERANKALYKLIKIYNKAHNNDAIAIVSALIGSLCK